MKDVGKLLLGVLLLLSTSLFMASISDYNSDALYAYSQARDLHQFGSLQGWTFSVIPFFFPDVFFSWFLTALTHSPIIFSLVASPIEIFLFIGFLAKYLSRTTEITYAKAFLAGGISAALLALAGPLLKQGTYFSLVQPFFLFCHHGFAASMAILIYLFCRENMFGSLRRYWFLSLPVLVIFTVSDFYFSFYFGLLILASFSRKQWADFLRTVIPFGVVSGAIFLLSWKWNPSVAIGSKTSLIPADFHQFLLISWKAFSLMLIPGLGLLWTRIKQREQIPCVLSSLYLAIVFAGALLLGGGLLSAGTFRYLTLLYGGAVVIFAYVLLRLPGKMKILGAVLLILLSSSLSIYVNFFREEPVKLLVYQDDIRCIENAAMPHSTLIATYWPAKVIFESLNRTYNLIQVDSTLGPYTWISNLRWRELYPDNHKTFLITEEVEPRILDALERDHSARLICEGKVLFLGKSPYEILPQREDWRSRR